MILWLKWLYTDSRPVRLLCRLSTHSVCRCQLLSPPHQPFPLYQTVIKCSLELIIPVSSGFVIMESYLYTSQLSKRPHIVMGMSLWLEGIHDLNTSLSITTEWTFVLQLPVGSIKTHHTTLLLLLSPNPLHTFIISEGALRCALMNLLLPCSAPDCLCSRKEENSWSWQSHL